MITKNGKEGILIREIAGKEGSYFWLSSMTPGTWNENYACNEDGEQLFLWLLISYFFIWLRSILSIVVFSLTTSRLVCFWADALKRGLKRCLGQ